MYLALSEWTLLRETSERRVGPFDFASDHLLSSDHLHTLEGRVPTHELWKSTTVGNSSS